MKKTMGVLAINILPAMAFAAADAGIISTLYADRTGNLAVKLDNGFPNSVAAGECSTFNGWAGVPAGNTELKAVLLSAKASQSPVRLSISGCEAGGAWLRVNGAYVE